MKKILSTLLFSSALLVSFIMPADALDWPWSKKIEKPAVVESAVVQQGVRLLDTQTVEMATTCAADVGIELTSDDYQVAGAISQVIAGPYCCSITNKSGEEMVNCLENRLGRIGELLSWLQRASTEVAVIKNSMCDQSQINLSLPFCAMEIIQEGDMNSEKVRKLANAIRCQLSRAHAIYFDVIPQGVNEASACIGVARQCYQTTDNYDSTLRGLIEDKRACLGQWLSNVVSLLMSPPPPGCTIASSGSANCTLDPPLPPVPSSQQQCF